MNGRTLLIVLSFAALAIRESSGISCYTCSSSPSKYDEDCYYGLENVPCTTCNSSQTSCWTNVINNFDGTYTVARDCYSKPTSKDYPWSEYSTICQSDLCNDHTPHNTPEIKCYSCSSTSEKYDDDCYHGRPTSTFTTCQGYCFEGIYNNFDGTFNVSRDCFRYKKDLVLSLNHCSYNWCNNGIPHITSSKSSFVSSMASKKLTTSQCASNPASTVTFLTSAGGKHHLWHLVGVVFFWRIFLNKTISD